ncbi:MAG: hypothetical protein ACR2JY_07140 [Chloroflexota bacterium]
MHHAPMTPDERYATLVETLSSDAGATLGLARKKGFGSAALQIGGRIFAMLSNSRLVVKLPRWRVNALTAEGVGERFDPRHNGRLTKEWLILEPGSDEEWLPLAREALEFVTATR